MRFVVGRSALWSRCSGLSVTIAVIAAMAGCGTTTTTDPADMNAPVAMPDLEPPPMVCRTPGALPGTWFTEVSTQMGITPAIVANTIHAGDLDEDGYADLIVSAAGANRETDKTRARFVLMNRPDPADPTGKTRVFVDFTKESGLLATRDGVGGFAFGVANIGDMNGDGHTDVVLGYGGGVDPAAVMLGDGTGHFHLGPLGGDLEKLLSMDNTNAGSASSSLLDFNRDGILDYLPGTFAYPPPNPNPPLLMQGLGDGTFREVADSVGLNVPIPDKNSPGYAAMYGITACDLDGDGNQDILFSDYGRQFNQVYLNKGGMFTEVGMATGIAADDRLDYSDDQSYRCYCYNRPGKCPMSIPLPEAGICTGFGIPGGMDGRGWFPGDSDQPFRLGGNNFGVACGDYDNDGDIDLMTATIRHGDVGSASDPSELLINNTAPGLPLMKFDRPGGVKTGIDRTSSEGGINWNEGDMTPVFLDLDLDGLKDIYLTSSDYPGDHGWVWHQKPDHTFEGVNAAAKIGQKEAHGVAFADFDHDGDLDAAIGTSTFRNGAPTAALRIWRNELGANANFIQVELRGLGKGHTNVSAIGARVKVIAGGVTQIQEVNGGYASSTTQSELALTFGLGKTCAIDSIEVRWLDAANTVTTYKDVRANYRVRITEGSPTVQYVF